MAYNNLWIARGGATSAGFVIHFEDNAPPACDTLLQTVNNSEFRQILPFTTADMWVVGRDSTASTVAVYHYDGLSWAQHLAAIPGELYCATGATDNLHVGGADKPYSSWFTRAPVMYLWNGSAWSAEVLPVIQTGLGVVHGLFKLSPTDIYACGTVGPIGWANNNYFALWHFDGISWSAVDTSAASSWAAIDMWGPDANNIWIVGANVNFFGGDNPSYEGRIYYYNGSTFTLQLASPTQAWAKVFHAVSGFSTSDVWAVGTAIAHWDGATWTQIAHPVNPLLRVTWQGLTCFAPNDLYISGTSYLDKQSQFILHWDGLSLTQVFTEVTALTPQMIHNTSALLASAPQLVSATTPNETTVRLTFDTEMKHVDPSNTNDALHVSNYALSTIAGKPRTVNSVTLVSASPTVVDLTLSGEMTNGVNYTITVSNAESTANLVIDPAHNSSTFLGLGILPRVSSGSAMSPVRVRVVFNEAMDNNAALINIANYVFTGPTSITATSIDVINSTTVDIHISGVMDTNGLYRVTIANVRDEAWNVIDPLYNYAEFLGIGTIIAEILINNQVVWSSENTIDQQTISLDVSSFYGIFPLKFRIRMKS